MLSVFVSLVAIIVLLMLIFHFCGHIFSITTNRLISNQMENSTALKVDAGRLHLLPKPVAQWLVNSGAMEQPGYTNVKLSQQGKLRLKPDGPWSKCTAFQVFSPSIHSFVWQIHTSLLRIPVFGRDMLQSGRGSMLITLAGHIPIVNVSTHPKTNISTQQRYLGEIVWFPKAALLSEITWEESGTNQATATLTQGDTKAEVTFVFKNQLPVQVIAYRYKNQTDLEPTKWVASIGEYKRFEGVLVPSKLEATWCLPEGDFTWFEFEITELILQ